MTSEVYDTDKNLLASITKPREHICNRKQWAEFIWKGTDGGTQWC